MECKSALCRDRSIEFSLRDFDAVAGRQRCKAGKFVMFSFLKKSKFAKSEDGAVSVDWVVLTAAIVGVAIAAIDTTREGVDAAASSISTGLSNQTVD